MMKRPYVMVVDDDREMLRVLRMKIWSKLLAKKRALFNFAIPSVLVVILFALASTPAYADTVSSSYDASREYSKTITIDNTEGVVNLNNGDKDDKKDDKKDKKDDKKDKKDKGDTDASTNVIHEAVWTYPTPPPQPSPEGSADEATHLKYRHTQRESLIAIINSSGNLVLDEGDKIAGVNSQALQRLELSFYVATMIIDAFPVLVQNALLFINESPVTLQEWAEVFLQQLPSEIQQEVDKLLLDARGSVR